MSNLTDPDFWDNFWKNTKIPAEIDLNFSFERCMAKAFSGIFEANPNLTLFEVGCAPGRWLSYFHKNFGYRISGIDNSDVGCQKTMDNFKLQEIEGKIYRADFLTFTPPEKYDIVISLGVIEHFDDPGFIVEKHLSFLAPGGKMILGMPNFRGINYLIQNKLDKDLLNKHNLKIMIPQFYRDITKRFHLSKCAIKYIGGFEPALFANLQKKNIILRIILKLARNMRRYEYFDNVNSAFFSSYLFGVLTNPF